MTIERLPTGIGGLDAVTRGGLPQGGIHLIVGRPGAGKSILGNQIVFAHAKRGGRAVYATLLSETHARLISQMRQLSFFDEQALGTSVVYLNALGRLETDGLDGLLKAVQQMVRDQKAELLVLDGLLPPAQLGVDDLTYKKFVAALQAWVGVIGCTVVILKTGAVETTPTAEQTMVDGIIELSTVPHGLRTLRQLSVTKLRGTGFLEGRHAYVIDSHGIALEPRVEAMFDEPDVDQPIADHIATGWPGFERIMSEGLVKGSTTLLLGSSGSGKSIASLHFAVEGAKRGEPVLFYGFFEAPHALRYKAARLGLAIEELEKKGLFHFLWRDPGELRIDRVAHRLLDFVHERKIKRVVVDGFAAFRTSDYPSRISTVFTAIANELGRSGVTMVVTDETRELYVRDVHVPTDSVSALFHNIVFMRQVELGATLRRLLGVLKTRDSGHDHRLWEFEIENRGLRVLEPFVASEHGLLRGDATDD